MIRPAAHEQRGVVHSLFCFLLILSLLVQQQVSGGFGITISSGSYPSGNVSASYSNVQGLTFATLGAGTTTVRNRPLLDITPLNRAPADMQRLTSSTKITMSIPELNIFQLYDDLKQAFRFVNALTAELPDHVKLSGERGVKYYEDMLLKGASRSVMQEFVASGDFDKAMRLRGSIESARLAGHNPSVAELATVMLLENAVYKRSETTGEITIAFTCPTMGVCSYTLSQFQQIFGNDVQKQQALIAQLNNGVKMLNYGGGVVLSDTMQLYFETMLRCAVEEPAVFRQFMAQYPNALGQYVQVLGVNPAAINAIVAEALREGSTKDTIKVVYDQNLSWGAKAQIGMSAGLVGIKYMAENGASFAAAAYNYNTDPAAKARVDDTLVMAKAFYEYAKAHPGELTGSMALGLWEWSKKIASGDPDAIGGFAVDIASGAAIAKALRWAGTAGKVEAATATRLANAADEVLPGGRLFWGSWSDYPKTTISGREYAQIGDRLYTRHAVERMQPSAQVGIDGSGRNITPQIVEHTISEGIINTNIVDGIIRTTYTSGNVVVVTEGGASTIVTVLRKSTP